MPSVLSLDAQTAHRVDSATSPTIEDTSTKVYIGWDTAALYLAFDVLDDSVLADAQNPYDGDTLEIGFDGQHDHVGYNADDYQLQITAGGRAFNRGGSLPAGITVASEIQPDGYTVEVRIPLGLLISTAPDEGQILGINFGLRDRDGSAASDAYLVWKGVSRTGWVTRIKAWRTS